MNPFKITLIISLIGILFLLFLMNILQPKQTDISNITNKNINQKFIINGTIIEIKTYEDSNFQVITLQDSTGKIDITINQILNLTNNQEIKVIGKITEYKNNLQIQADEIIN